MNLFNHSVFLFQGSEVSWKDFWSGTRLQWTHKQHNQQDINKNKHCRAVPRIPYQHLTSNHSPTTGTWRASDQSSVVGAGSIYTNLKSKNVIRYKTDAQDWLENIPEQQILTSYMQLSQLYLQLLATNTYGKINNFHPQRVYKTATNIMFLDIIHHPVCI
jgi:hypothetical protein